MAASREVCRRARISYRQLDHWVGQGLVATAEGANPGTGHERWFTALECQRVIHAAKLMRAVNCPPRTAFALLDQFEARGLAEDDGAGDARWVTLVRDDVHLRLFLAPGYLTQVRDASRRAQQRAVRPQPLAAAG